MRTVWLGILGIAVLAGVVWMSRMSTDQAESKSIAGPVVDDSEALSTPEVNSTADTGTGTGEAASPFEVVDENAPTDTVEASTQSDDVGSAVGQGSLQSLPEAPPANRNDSVVEDTSVSGQPASSESDPGAAGLSAPIEVPESYPVTEAEQYFVPPEERRPGNLGGPPPLDFPGGPSDPNRQDATLTPPAAPGQ